MGITVIPMLALGRCRAIAQIGQRLRLSGWHFLMAEVAAQPRVAVLPGKKNGRSFLRSASLLCVWVLENEFQSELDLTRVVRIVARRANFAERRRVRSIREVRRTRNCHNAVAAKSRGIEVGMVR